MANNHGGTVLRVDLTRGKITRESIPEKIKKDFVGGRGLGVKYFYDEVDPGADPLGPENKLFVLNGPLAGTNAMSVARWMVITKSPLTDGFTRAVGGADFAAYLRFAGLDMVILEGKAEKPVYLFLADDGTAELRDASELWGKDTWETQVLLKKWHEEGNKKVNSAVIGPGGEKLVRFAVIESERRTASRGGVGTVMGSKNVKAIAVKASRNIQLADQETFKSVVKKQIDTMQADPMYPHFQKYGTAMAEGMAATGLMPCKNFQEGPPDNFMDISGDVYDRYTLRHVGCYSCSIRCGKVRKTQDPRYRGAETEGPEYESIWVFTTDIGSTAVEPSLVADKICDDLGIDTISAGATIAFAFELYNRGIITKQDTDGLELSYGNTDAMISLLEKIGKREGFGDLLAEGSYRAARKIGRGAEHYVMTSKKQELPAYDPRGAKAQGLSMATATTGANHNYGYAFQEIFNVPIPYQVDRFAETGKGNLTCFNQNLTAVLELGIGCTFPGVFGWLSMEILGQLLAAATGYQEFQNPQYLLDAAERTINLERLFNLRAGLSRKDDSLPERVQKEMLARGASQGHKVDDMEGMLDEYYASRGWDKKGIPTPETLTRLKLAWAIKDLKQIPGQAA